MLTYQQNAGPYPSFIWKLPDNFILSITGVYTTPNFGSIFIYTWNSLDWETSINPQPQKYVKENNNQETITETVAVNQAIYSPPLTVDYTATFFLLNQNQYYFKDYPAKLLINIVNSINIH